MKIPHILPYALCVGFALISCQQESIQPNAPDEMLSGTAAAAPSQYGTYTIKNAAGNLFMEVTGNPGVNEKFKDGVKIVQWSATSAGDLWQKWQIIYKQTVNNIPYYALMNLHSGKVLDVPNSSTTNGLQLQQYRYNGTNAQLWEIRQVTSGYAIINKGNGLAVTNLNSSTSNGTAIVQQTYSAGAANQRWILTALAADSYLDDEVTRYFQRNSASLGSVAWDQGSSIPLTWGGNNGKVLWVTQDAWDGAKLQPNGMFNCTDFFDYNNSIIIQQDKNNWLPDDPNMTINSPMGRPKQICSNQPGTNWSWPGNGVEIGDKVYMHCGEGNGLSMTNQSIYVLTQSTGTLWTVQRTTPAGMSGQTNIGYAAGMVKASDGYVYVYGTQATSFGYLNNVHVARFPTSNPGSWTFWNGSSWTSTPTTGNGARIAEGKGTVAINYVNGKYVMITMDQGFNCDAPRNIYTATSTSPTGPFTTAVEVYKINDYFQGQYTRYYTPNVHPTFTNGRNELLITYSVNQSACGVNDCVNGYIDPNYYRIRALRIPYSKIGL
ncbi:RICIN domain-containing protein [Dawidia soli]|uniref:RICIN domain-containing protein n=1 Tax=Dawidia soli TaxID=2782352 RepID=A0AAP2DCM0_9BACT|nr:RICIN domain-containing protein [Dawidia soli]MBT1688631.1 RICIN domain-containing protein [Dawidia soli]